MGGSSILAAAILRSVAACLQIELTNERLVDLVSAVEQLLTTGGGWQDQVLYWFFDSASVELHNQSPKLPSDLKWLLFLIMCSSCFVMICHTDWCHLWWFQDCTLSSTATSASHRRVRGDVTCLSSSTGGENVSDLHWEAGAMTVLAWSF